MQFWQDGTIHTPLLIAFLLFIVELSRRFLPILKVWNIPNCIIAGCLGLLLGPQVLDLLPMQTHVLEWIVYHGLAIVFISIGLQQTERKKTSDTISFAFGLPFICALQIFIGISILLISSLFVLPSHPGFGFSVR